MITGWAFQNESFTRKINVGVYGERCKWISSVINNESLSRILNSISFLMDGSQSKISQSWFLLSKAEPFNGKLDKQIKTGVEKGFGSEYRCEWNAIAFFAFFGQATFWCMNFTKIQQSVLLQNKSISIDTRMVEVETKFPYRCESEYGYESNVEESLFRKSQLTVFWRKDRN